MLRLSILVIFLALLGKSSESNFFSTISGPFSLIFPYNFFSTLSHLSYFQLLVSTQDLMVMQTEFKNSKFQNYFDWFFSNIQDPNAKNGHEKGFVYRDCVLKRIIWYLYNNFSNNSNQLAAFMLLVSPNVIIIDGSAYIPWHFLRVFLVMHGVLEEEYTYSRDFDNYMSFSGKIGSRIDKISISQRSIYKMLYKAFLKLEEPSHPDRNELYLVLKNTLDIFLKYSQLMRHEKDFLLSRAFLLRLNTYSNFKNISWRYSYPGTYSVMHKHTVKFEDLKADLFKKMVGIRIILGFNIAILLICFCYSIFGK